LNAGGGHQAPRKTAHYLQKDVGQNIKDKKKDKKVRDGDLSQEGSLKREVSSFLRITGYFYYHLYETSVTAASRKMEL